MKIVWRLPLTINLWNVLEEAGYHRFTDPNTGKESLVRRLSSNYYPRFHLFVQELASNVASAASGDGNVLLDLHLDQKHARHHGVRAHAGEKDGEVVEQELRRVHRWLVHYSHK